eukprot:3783393-Pleurochrysis_carterae.AAC.4
MRLSAAKPRTRFHVSEKLLPALLRRSGRAFPTSAPPRVIYLLDPTSKSKAGRSRMRLLKNTTILPQPRVSTERPRQATGFVRRTQTDASDRFEKRHRREGAGKMTAQ